MPTPRKSSNKRTTPAYADAAQVTGSTWFARVLNDFGDHVAIRHQWLKAKWERRLENPDEAAARRARFLDLSARCPTRYGACYAKGHSDVDATTATRRLCLDAKLETRRPCDCGPRPGARVRGATFNPVALWRPAATAEALCADDGPRPKLLVARARRADSSLTRRGPAAAATWIFRGDESRRRRGRDVDIPLDRDRLRYMRGSHQR